MQREEERERVSQRQRAVAVCTRWSGRVRDGATVEGRSPTSGCLGAPASCSASSLTLSAELVGLVPLPLSPASMSSSETMCHASPAAMQS